MATDIRKSVQAYRAQYGPEGENDSFPIPNQMGTTAGKVEKRLEPYFSKDKYPRCKSKALELARLDVSAELLGTHVTSSHGLWRAQLQALEDWANNATEADVKWLLRKTGWYQIPSQSSLNKLLAIVSTTTQVKLQEVYNVS